MGINLYPHQTAAYSTALSMMDAVGKAAIIHPTGTGKSFVGFKLAEQYPSKRICWLSPSEYIFRTQLENLTAAARLSGQRPEGVDQEPDVSVQAARDAMTDDAQSGGFGNITFLTYARLMVSDDGYVESLCPDYIILDEFHRCGAAAKKRSWEAGAGRGRNAVI